MHYQSKDINIENRMTKDSMRSISDRTSIINSKFKLKWRLGANIDSKRKDYIFQSSDENTKNNKDSVHFNHSLRKASKYISHKRLENNASSNIITIEKNNMLDSPSYDNASKNMRSGTTSNSIAPSRHNHNKIKQQIKIYKTNDKEFAENTMDQIFDRIDQHLDKYSSNDSSRNKLIKNRDKSLVLPSLSYRPGNVEAIKSVDMRRSKMKERSLRKIRKAPSKLQTKNLKSSPFKASPMGSITKVTRSISRKIHNFVKPENTNESVSLLNSNKNRLKGHLSKLAKMGKKKSIGLNWI
jgi:hypothetical protein